MASMKRATNDNMTAMSLASLPHNGMLTGCHPWGRIAKPTRTCNMDVQGNFSANPKLNITGL